MLRLQSTPHGARLAQLHQNLPFLRKIVSLGDVLQDPPNDFQTFGADFVQPILCSVPRWKIEIDQVDHRNPDLVKGSVIVGHSAIEIGKMSTLAERIGGGKNVASQVSR